MEKGNIAHTRISINSLDQKLVPSEPNKNTQNSKANKRIKKKSKNSKIKILEPSKPKINPSKNKDEQKVKLSDCIRFKDTHNFDSLYDDSQIVYKEAIKKSLYTLGRKKSEQIGINKQTLNPRSSSKLRGSKSPTQPKQNNQLNKPPKTPLTLKENQPKNSPKCELEKADETQPLSRKFTIPKIRKLKRYQNSVIIDKFFKREINQEKDKMAKNSFIQSHINRINKRAESSKFDKVVIKDIMVNDFMIPAGKLEEEKYASIQKHSTKRIKLRALRSIDKTIGSLQKRIRRSLQNKSISLSPRKRKVKMTKSSSHGNSLQNIIEESFCSKNIFMSNLSLSSIPNAKLKHNPVHLLKSVSEASRPKMMLNEPLACKKEHNFLTAPFCKSLTRHKAPLVTSHVRRSTFSRYKNSTLDKTLKSQNLKESPAVPKILNYDKQQKSMILRRKPTAGHKRIPLPKSLYRLMKL
ncbi:unnamed protein product [Moneuplotes crassus]|uniref:Uncharacterized protein n=1 Tax=Euplotes crassus TaxID=5936 RepID=A0AAD1Y821_EUPCR|nr:unnamed protein product [Moneuplotes crassus]